MKHLCLIFAVIYAFTLSNAFALTSNERKLVQKIQNELHQAQTDYASAKADLLKADDRAANAQNQAAQTAADLKVLKDQIDVQAREIAALKGQVAKMKPVYDQCTSHWGLGAIAYGVGELVKHLLIAAAVVAVLGIGIWVLSIVAPVTAPIIMIGLRAIGGIFAGAGRGIAALFTLIHNGLTRLLSKKSAATAQDS